MSENTVSVGVRCSWCGREAKPRELQHVGGWAWLHRNRAKCASVKACPPRTGNTA